MKETNKKETTAVVLHKPDIEQIYELNIRRLRRMFNILYLVKQSGYQIDERAVNYIETGIFKIEEDIDHQQRQYCTEKWFLSKRQEYSIIERDINHE